MVDVNEKNFWQWFPVIESSIKSAAFVAIDLEFLGLPSSSHPKAVSLFDTPAQRYEKLCDAVRRFPPCQLGLSCFQETPNGYTVEVFCVSLFKRLCKQVFSFSLSAMTFLAQHNFDFNKFVSEGCTYSNKTEVARLKREIITGEIDYDTFTDGLDHRLLLLKSRILMEARDTETDETYRREAGSGGGGQHRTDSVRLSQPILIELTPRERDADEMETQTTTQQDTPERTNPLWERPLTSLESSLVVFVLSEEFPNLDFQIDHTRTLLYVAERPLIFRNIGDKKRHKQLLKNVLTEISGCAQIFSCLSERKPVLVGHNSLLDLLYIYNCFEADLPDTYEKWKKAMMTTFPFIVDTKVLAAAVQDSLFSRGVTDLSLQTLGNYFDSPSCGEILPFDTPSIIGGEHSQGIFDDGEHYHNAAFDALITGEVFLKLAHLYAHTRCSSAVVMTESWPLRKLSMVLRAQIVNRVPIPLIDTQHCNLAGDDPVGNRPDLIRVRRRHHLGWLHSLSGGTDSRLQRWADGLMDRYATPTLMPSEETSRMREDLVRVLGGFRVELRVADEGATAVIATNTANTYARVCSFFSAHDDYYLMDEMTSSSDGSRLTYEQRLCAWRTEKDSTTERERSSDGDEPNGWKWASTSSCLLVLSVFIAGLAVRKLIK